MKKYNIIIFASILILILGLFMVINKNKSCRLCTTLPHHAPCLVNLGTGEVGELCVYDSDPDVPGELAAVQTTGHSSIMPMCGSVAFQDRDKNITVIKIITNQNEYGKKYFCDSCRKILSPYSQTDFVIADIYDPMTPIIYPIQDKASYAFRCYKIDIHSGKEQEYIITVHGTLDANR